MSESPKSAGSAKLPEVSWMPQFAETAARYEAWWNCELIDRPLIRCSVHEPPKRTVTPLDDSDPDAPKHATMRERWLDVDYFVDQRIAHYEKMICVGDTIPVIWANVGPELTGTLFDVELEFSERTSWSIPWVESAQQWEQVLQMKPNFDNIYWQTAEAMTAKLIERCEGRYIVGIHDLHGNIDMLASLREPQELCMDVLDEPELVGKATMHMAEAFVQGFDRLYKQVADAGFGSSTWLPFYHQGPAYVPSCDFWCMLSPEVGKQMIVPAIEREMQPLQRSIFHLDGPDALSQLDNTLNLKGLNALQWVWGSGNGPAHRWIDVYKKAQAAGKALDVTTVDAEDAIKVLEAIDPAGVWLNINQPFESTKQAQEFIDDVQRRFGR